MTDITSFKKNFNTTMRWYGIADEERRLCFELARNDFDAACVHYRTCAARIPEATNPPSKGTQL